MKRGQSSAIGFALITVFFVIALVAFATIEPLKETLDDVRDTTSLNCPGTSTFDSTDYNDDTSLEKLTRRPVCFVTGFTMVWFVVAVIIASITWVFSNWRRTRK